MQQDNQDVIFEAKHTRTPERLTVEIPQYYVIGEDFQLRFFVELDEIKVSLLNRSGSTSCVSSVNFAVFAITWALGINLYDLNNCDLPEALTSRPS